MVNDLRNNYRRASLADALNAFYEKKQAEKHEDANELDVSTGHDFRKSHNIPRKHW